MTSRDSHDGTDFLGSLRKDCRDSITLRDTGILCIHDQVERVVTDSLRTQESDEFRDQLHAPRLDEYAVSGSGCIAATAAASHH
jgi:hypothetical protein